MKTEEISRSILVTLLCNCSFFATHFFLYLMLPTHRGQVNTSSSTTNMTYRGTNFGGKDNRVDEVNRSLLEQENDRKWEELGAKVSTLKMLSKEINNEVDSQNRLLDGMGASFSSAADLFSTTIGKLGTMVSSNSSNHMYYLIGFVVFVFIVIYFMMRR